MTIRQFSNEYSNRELDRLLRNVADGDMEAFEQLYHETHASVYAFALSILKNSHDAQDVLHDCYPAVYGAASGYRSSGKPMAWIITITKNLCLKQLREREKNASLSLEDWKDHIDLCTNMTADDKVVIEQCMERLSDEERQIVVLHAVAGFKHRQIGEMLDLALPTVLSKYHRAIKKMRAYL
jgi:RNA polymerase sigma-70 factor (ECF subfamily)